MTILRNATRIIFAALLAAAWTYTVPAEAQQIAAGSQQEHDRVRISGFIWRAKPSGSLRFEELAGVAGFEQGIDVTDQLGFDEVDTGWILEGNFAPGRRHRLILEAARLETSGEAVVTFPGTPSLPAFTVNTFSDINLREFHGFYNFLVAAGRRAEVGVLGGIGWFDTSAIVRANVGSASASLDQVFPSFGGNAMINPVGPVRGYIEITGFPRVEINELSGWQLDITARAEVFVVRNFGVMVGFRRYRLVFEDLGDDFGVDLMWQGLTFGAQVRY